MKVAIVGAGLAGLATSFYLSKYQGVEVFLFDHTGIGKGASGASTGLLHPFPGKRALKSWKGIDAMQESMDLLELASGEMKRKVYNPSGVFRPAITLQQKHDFFLATEENVSSWINHPRFGEGLWIPQGVTVFSEIYLEGLWRICKRQNVELVIQKITSLQELDSFDEIIVTAGFETLAFDECKQLNLEMTKGQALICRLDEKLPFSLSSQGHISQMEDETLCQVGSTYERNFSDLKSDPEVSSKLLKQVSNFYPEALNFEVLDIKVGVRIATPKRYRPVVERVGAKATVFTGLGSRGLLYHAFFAKKVAEGLVSRKEELL